MWLAVTASSVRLVSAPPCQKLDFLGSVVVRIPRFVQVLTRPEASRSSINGAGPSSHSSDLNFSGASDGRDPEADPDADADADASAGTDDATE